MVIGGAFNEGVWQARKNEHMQSRDRPAKKRTHVKFVTGDPALHTCHSHTFSWMDFDGKEDLVAAQLKKQKKQARAAWNDNCVVRPLCTGCDVIGGCVECAVFAEAMN